jgi:hypothetical protein
MRLIFDHTKGFGKMRNQVIYHVPFGAVFEPNEYDEALNTGWFPADNRIWFQCRSTRISLQDYKPKASVLKAAQNVKYFPDVNMTADKKARLEEIYKKYLAHKQYKDQSYTIDDIIKNSHGHIYYVVEGKIVAFLFFKTINKALLAIEFAWDYEDPKLSLGNVSIYYASLLAKFKGCSHIYLSAGYESCSIYKSKYEGFEWWTGWAWSRDVDTYIQLCYDDDIVVVANYKYAQGNS